MKAMLPKHDKYTRCNTSNFYPYLNTYKNLIFDVKVSHENIEGHKILFYKLRTIET